MSNQKSFPPVYGEAPQQASEHLRQVIPLVNKHKTALNPVNYAVWYEYVSGQNQQLKDEIDTRLSNQLPITQEVTQVLYEKYILLDMPERLEQANNVIKLVVDNTMSNINWAEAATSHCVSDLTHSQQVLDNCSDITTLKQVISNILSNTQSLTQTSQELRSELEKSSEEIEKLKSELLTVKEISRTDGLTGLLNRSTFDRELEEVCAHQVIKVLL